MFAKPFANWPWGGWRVTFEEADRLRRQMDQVMRGVPREGFFTPAAGVFPLSNMTEDKDHYYVRAELPGIEPSAVEISVTGKTLSLSGERKIPTEEGGSYHRRERRAGTFSRTITLPTEIDFQKILAKAKNGVLTITLPKSEAAKPRQISITE
jgi:HSP20 family protein